MDYLQRAEIYARKLANSKSGFDFHYLTTADRGLAIAFSEELEKRDRQITALTSLVHTLKTQRDSE